MEMVKRLGRMRELVRDVRQAGETMGFVPTMGYLHEGHLALVRRAHEMADRVVVSIFVNPTQFGPGEDFETYPRDLNRDADLCRKGRVDFLFVPEARDVYPPGFRTYVEVGGLGAGLCGKHRPGHFRGVATVVAKLLALVRPDFAFFGQKDAQQLVIVRRLTRDLNLDTEIVGCPTEREADGVAMSSRNVRLSPAERAEAPVLYRSLREVEAAHAAGQRRVPPLLEALRRGLARAPRGQVEYAEIVDAETLEPLEEVQRDALVAVAVRFGPTRLIDNLVLEAGPGV